jgi:glycosyltransferase involved in cell wall biosynthesis
VCFKSSIVIAADSWVGSTTFGIAQGFQKLGYEVAQVSQTTSLKLGVISNATRIINRLNRPINIALYNMKILQVAEQLESKIFLTVKGNYIKPKTLETLLSRGIKTINYYPDFRFSYDSVDQKTFSLYSTFITTKSFQVDSLKQMIGKDKVHFLHHGYCSDIHYPPVLNPLIENHVPDVLYIGTFTPYKEKLLSALVALNPNINLKIYGYDWHNASNNDLLRPCIVNRPVLGLNYAQLVNSAKINLAFHMGEADDTNWQDLVSTRSFELPACKGFMLHIDNPEIRQLYDVGNEIDVFSNAEDLSRKISFYLANESMRQKMINKAYSRCVPAYSYDQRAIEIAALIES